MMIYIIQEVVTHKVDFTDIIGDGFSGEILALLFVILVPTAKWFYSKVEKLQSHTDERLDKISEDLAYLKGKIDTHERKDS